jgi:hypothetical protein
LTHLFSALPRFFTAAQHLRGAFFRLRAAKLDFAGENKNPAGRIGPSGGVRGKTSEVFLVWQSEIDNHLDGQSRWDSLTVKTSEVC